MDTLDHVHSGSDIATTTSGTRYRLDFDGTTLTRTLPGPADEATRAMRPDGKQVGLLNVTSCTIGEPLRLALILGLSGVAATTRISTRVVDITQEEESPR